MNQTNQNIDDLIVEFLVNLGLITPEKSKRIERERLTTGKSFETIISEQGLVKPEAIADLKQKLTVVQRGDDRWGIEQKLSFNNLTINLSARNVLQILIKIICFLTSVHLLTQFAQRYIADFPLRDGLALLFYFDNELNIPSVYSALTLLVCAIILSFISSLKRSKHDVYVNYWRGLSVIFGLLSFDELVSLHEKMVEPVRTGLNTGGIFYFAWVIPAAFGVLAFLIIFLRFILNLPRKTRNHFLIAGAIYISGAIGCELFGGYIAEKYTTSSILYLVEVTLEESLEMLGIAVFIYGLLSHISDFTQGAILNIQIPGKKLIPRLSNFS